MSEMDFDEITSAAPLTDVRKGRIAPPRKARRRSENDVIDEPDVKDGPTQEEDEEEEQPILKSPKPVIPPMNPLQAMLISDIKSAILKRKSEPVNEPIVTRKQSAPPPTAATDIEERTSDKLTKLSGLKPELQKKKIRSRPKTMDLGDLNLLNSFPSKKSPAPSVPKITEEQVKAAAIPEPKVASPVKEEEVVAITRDPDAPKAILKQIGRSQRVEKKQLRAETSVEAKINPKHGLTVTTTQMTSHEDKQLKSNVQLPEKNTKIKNQAVEMSSKVSDVKTTNIEKVKLSRSQDTKADTVKAASTTVVETKTVSVESKTSSKKAMSAKILASDRTKVVETKLSPSITEATKIQITSMQAQTTTAARKVVERSQIVVTPTTKPMNTAADSEKIIKNTADSLSGIKSSNSNRTISETNIPLSHKSKSIDKNVNIDGENLIKTNAVDYESVRDVTNELMEESYRIFKQRKEKKITFSSQAKDTVVGSNLKTDVTKPTEPLTVTNIKTQPIKREDIKVETASIILARNKEKELDMSKNKESNKVAPISLQSEIRLPSSNVKVDEAPSKVTSKQELDKIAASTLDSNKSMKPSERQKENIAVITKADQDLKNVSGTSSMKTISQVTKHIATTHKFLQQPSSTVDKSAKPDASSKSELIKSELGESKLKNRLSWIENASKESLSKQTSLADQAKSSTDDKQTNAATTNQVFGKLDPFKFGMDKQRSLSSDKLSSRTAASFSSAEKKVDVNETPNKMIGNSNEKSKTQTNKFDSFKFNIDKQRSLSSDKLTSRTAASSSSAVKKDDVSETPVKTVENGNEKSNNSDKIYRKVGATKIGSAFAKSASKENLSLATPVISVKLQDKSTKVEATALATAEKSASEVQTEAIISNFRLRNNIPIENLNSNKDQASSNVTIKPTDSSKKPIDNKEIVNEIVPKVVIDPFSANRRNNIFRKLSDAQTVSKEDVTTEVNAEKETKDAKTIVDKDVSVKIRSTWRAAANIKTLPNEEKETKPNISTSTAAMNIPRSFEVKKEVATSPIDIFKNASVVTKVSPDVTLTTTRTPNYNISRSVEIKQDTDVAITKMSAFGSPTRASTCNVLLKRSMNTLSPDKEESRIQPTNESISKKLTENKEVTVKTNVEPNVEYKWKRPVTLAFQKDEPKTSTDSPTELISSATIFLQGNKISKAVFGNRTPSATSNTNLKSTPTSCLTSLQEIEPMAAKQSPAKPTDSPANPNKVSPTGRYESPTFNKMFLPKSTFRSPTSAMNKSTEDVSAIRGSNSFRQNRPQTLTGNEHVVIQRTLSAAPKVDTTIQEKSESGAADFFQQWKNKRKAIP